MTQFGIGQSVSRFEDPRLLRGQGQFVDDNNLPGQAYAVLVRSPHAHARIRSINTALALAATGVLAVYTGEDVAADGLGTMKMSLPRKRPDGGPMFYRQHQGLSRGEVKYVGDPVALVIAETLWQAKDAAEAVEEDYEPLASVTDTLQLVQGEAAPVWAECPDNLSHIFEQGNLQATEAAFAKAHRVVKRRYVISRVYAHYMQPRGVLAQYDAGEDRYTIWADVQYPHRARNALAENIFKIPEHQIRVISHDVGGGFGTKGWQYPEHRLMPWAARKIGRPIKWTCERSEAILADEHARLAHRKAPHVTVFRVQTQRCAETPPAVGRAGVEKIGGGHVRVAVLGMFLRRRVLVDPDEVHAAVGTHRDFRRLCLVTGFVDAHGVDGRLLCGRGSGVGEREGRGDEAGAERTDRHDGFPRRKRCRRVYPRQSLQSPRGLSHRRFGLRFSGLSLAAAGHDRPRRASRARRVRFRSLSL